MHSPKSRRRGRDSRCCDSANAPYEWLDFTDGANGSATELADWIGRQVPFTRDWITGEIEALFEAAQEGLLEDSGDERTPIKPIHPEPEVFELRRTLLTSKLRFYHAEPSVLPHALASLHAHIKRDAESQRQEIAHAIRRYKDCARNDWA